MVVLILLIVAAVLFGFQAIYGGVVTRENWPQGAASLGWCLVSIALAIWYWNGGH